MGTPLFMRDVTLNLRLASDSVGARAEFNCDVHTAEIIPSAGDEVTYSTLCAEGSYSSRGKTTYALHLVAAQRWAIDGLSTFLWDHDGEIADFQYQAHGDGVAPAADAPGMTGQVTLVAGNYGGEVDTYAELEVTLPCVTKPVKTVAAFPALADAETEAPAAEGAAA
jgi:hypothetical protein